MCRDAQFGRLGTNDVEQRRILYRPKTPGSVVSTQDWFLYCVVETPNLGVSSTNDIKQGRILYRSKTPGSVVSTQDCFYICCRDAQFGRLIFQLVGAIPVWSPGVTQCVSIFYDRPAKTLRLFLNTFLHFHHIFFKTILDRNICMSAFFYFY